MQIMSVALIILLVLSVAALVGIARLRIRSKWKCPPKMIGLAQLCVIA